MIILDLNAAKFLKTIFISSFEIKVYSFMNT